MQLCQFQFDLPDAAIAQHPTARREDARLFRLSRGTGETDTSGHASDLVAEARPGDCWVINDTRVRPARVLCQKSTGGRVELLVLSAQDRLAEAMYRAAKPLRDGQDLRCTGSPDVLTVVQNHGGGRVTVALPDTLDAVLARAGQVPLPPYIDRAPVDTDRARYQTVYAQHPGAVAAPTAGLHFTPALMAAMEARGATFARVTLHVGPGTFRPIRVDNIDEHTLHHEHWEVSAEAAAQINAADRVVAVGTTSVRTLETAGKSGTVQSGTVQPGSGETGLYITPGYEFRAVDAMLTNFHLPGSSLLVLVSAFAGHKASMRAYRQAVTEGFRFYSYGDAMFIS